MQDQTYKIPLSKIVLDNLNPRFPPVNTEAEAIVQLVDNEKIHVLAKDIAENGISPIESFALLEQDDGNYLTLEGNRRICALKLLIKP